MEKEMSDAKSGMNLDVLHARVRLDLSVNELRIVVGCFKAIAHQMEIENEPYLDGDGIALKTRLESLYEKTLEDEARKLKQGRPPGKKGSRALRG